MYGVELIIIIIGTIGQAISGSGPSVNMIGPLIFWRVFMGVGIGWGYPVGLLDGAMHVWAALYRAIRIKTLCMEGSHWNQGE